MKDGQKAIREVLLKKLHENVHVTGVQNRFGSFTAKERFWHFSARELARSKLSAP
jgi:hypothetical protein